jgi:hypothetical protein
MTSLQRCRGRVARVIGAALLLSVASTAQAQFFRQAVGGVSIDPKGVLSNARHDANGLRQFWVDLLKPVPDELARDSKLRKISLKGLAALLNELEDKAALPDEVRFLAGLQRVEYVLVYPELNDIVLVGFGEGWKVDERGNVVGVTTRRPVMQVDDLVVALRMAGAASQGPIQCSIDPTKEGLERIQQMASKFLVPNQNPKVIAAEMEQALGPQTISFQNVPPTSRFAHVLLAADYRMKRLGMNFDPSHVKGLPSYLQMLKSNPEAGATNMMPRWWLTTNYDPLLADKEGLAWQLRGQGVKTMAEEEFIGPDGQRKQAGKAGPLSQKWADSMTAKYDELSLKEPIFGELRNCMDLAVVAALIFQENLAAKAALDLGALIDPAVYPIEEFNLPKQVDTKVSYIHASGGYIMSASGGVDIDSWADARRKETGDLAPVRSQVAESRGKLWWWN